MIVVLHNIRSTYNVGAILRTADGFGVERVILSGYTPRVHDDSLLPHLREKLDHQIAKTALGAEESAPILNATDIEAELAELKQAGRWIIGLENNIDDARLCELGEVGDRIDDIITEHGTVDVMRTELEIALVLGEEVLGIPKELYKYIDFFAEIPMKGRKESFNVSVAAGIAMYELSRLY